MLLRVLLFLTLVILPTVASAAYQNPTVIANERQPNGFTKLIFRFTGTAGEPAVTRDYTVSPTTTAARLRNWVDATIDELDLMHTAATLPALQPGQSVPRLAPTPPTPSAKAAWRMKVVAFRESCGHGFAGNLATACAALKTDIEATYQAGFLDVD